MSTGLVLTSGGARGAYQAGALQAMSEILDVQTCPFDVITGVSAGSINAAYLASRVQDFRAACVGLSDLWCNLKPDEVFITKGTTLAQSGVAWLARLGLGKKFGGSMSEALLMTSPLRRLIEDHIDFNQLAANVEEGRLRGVAIAATNYYSASSVVFYDSKEPIEPWIRTMRIATPAKLAARHVMASTALPVFFPAIEVDGAYYGDGSIRMFTPLSPAIHLGADRLVVIGVRHEKPAPSQNDFKLVQSAHYPFPAEIGGVLLNALFLDALEEDIERLKRINLTVSTLAKVSHDPTLSKLREIPVLVLKPSQDLGAMAASVLKRFSFPIRHLLQDLGVSELSGLDLLSYLSFEKTYTAQLVSLGYEDTMRKRALVLDFFTST